MEASIGEESDPSLELEHGRPRGSVEIDVEGDSISVSNSLDNPLPILLEFVDVEYTVGVGNENPVRWAMGIRKGRASKRHKILKGLTGSVSPGEILALMGPSGSGKTTLLNIIGGRLDTTGDVSGIITYNETLYTPALKRRIGFVAQDDVLFPQLTVEETLVFAAFLRLPKNMTRQQKYSKADAVIKQLSLERCRHTKIGGAFVRGISGGERKRTSIGYEILVDPSLLLLDEPTSGLDSTCANNLLRVLQNLAKDGRTIITTIHQPSSRIFYKFDKLLLMSEGHGIYHGKVSDSMGYFSSLGFVPEIAMNPAEFLLDLATGQVNDIRIPNNLRGSLNLQDFEMEVIKFLQMKYKSEIETKGKEESYKKTMAPNQPGMEILVKRDWTIGWLEQFLILCKRTFVERRADYLDKLRLFQAVGVAILLGLLWWKSKIGTEAQLRDQVGLMFYLCIFWTSSSLFGAVYVFPYEKAYLVKEKKADMYRMSVFYVCSTLCDMVAHMLYPTIFLLILYFMVDLRRSAAHFFLTLFAILLIVLTSQGIGELFGAITLNVKKAGFMASLVLMVFLLTGGYYVQHLPKFMRWMKHISFMHYGFRLLLKVQYSGNLLFECQGQEKCTSIQSSPSFDTIDLYSRWDEIWILIAMALTYRLLAYLCLCRRVNVTSA